jgi:CRISPR type IV-associated protein Csf3
MQPFTIEFNLVEPMVQPSFPIHLDNLIASCKVQEARHAKKENPLEVLEHLPLEKLTIQNESCWMAGTLQGTRNENAISHQFYRKYEIDVYAENRGTLWQGRADNIGQGSGAFRAYSLSEALAFIPTLQVSGIGDIPEIERLLTTHLRFLGKQNRNGWGRIKSIEIKPDENAKTEWRKRNLPLSFEAYALPEHKKGYGGKAPPYWDRIEWEAILEWPTTLL